MLTDEAFELSSTIDALKEGQDYSHERITKEETMIRLIAIAFALAVATSVQAMPVAPLHHAGRHDHASPRSMRCR